MRLRSSELSTTEEVKSDSYVENLDAIDEKRSPLKLLVDGIVDKGAKKAENKECVDNAVDDLIVCVKEGNESVLDSGLKENKRSSVLVSGHMPQYKEVMECNNWSEDIEPVSVVDDDNVVLHNSLYDCENAVVSTDGGRGREGEGGWEKKNLGNQTMEETSYDADMMVKLKVDEADEAFTAVDGNCEGTGKRKRGRKRKILVSSECNGNLKSKMEKIEKRGVEISGRVLRSRSMTMSGGVKVADSGLNESVAGFKRKMEAECLDQTELQKAVNESIQMTGRLQKKQKGRGRPPKVQGEAVFKRKIKAECLSQHELQKRRGRPPKTKGEATPLYVVYDDTVSVKLERHGRPPKVQDEELVLEGIQKSEDGDMVMKNLKRRGRPPKKQKRMMVKKTNNQLEVKVVKEGPKIHDKQKGNASEESNDHTMAEDTVKGHNTGKDIVNEPLKSSIGGAERRKKQQLVRDQIVSMLMKAGWTIEYRPRLQREYLDAVYVDPNGGTHWSITKAYRSLKKRSEDGHADSKEVSAFTPIPDEEMSVLFKLITKVRSDKNKKKNKRGKNDCKAKIVFSGEAPPKKKPGKKSKDGIKRKEVHSSAVKLASKSSGVKVKGDKSRQRQPKKSQKGRPSRKPRLVARSSNEGLDQGNDGCTMYSVKRNLLSWMIDLGVIMPGGKVQYGEGRRRSGLSEGMVTCDGIQCSCCNEIMDISSFVSHRGGRLTLALNNIYFQHGSSLLKCLLDSWRKEEESSSIRFNYVDINGDDPNDDTCNICGDGGDLTCCDGCPSTFHHSCLDIKSFPSGDWHCIYCSCKFCGLAAGGASQMDDSHHAFNSEMLSCCLCEEKCMQSDFVIKDNNDVHQLCLQEEDAINADSSHLSFCGRKCQELFEQLQTYLGVKFELDEGYSWTLLHRSDVSQDSTFLDDPLKVECNSKLALAFAVMDECFVPIMDERSGVNTIHNVFFMICRLPDSVCSNLRLKWRSRSNFRRLNYSGFFTAILEKGDELVSAASIRIHGHRLAEMPFIGTRHMYRRQGMCRRLLDAIENALSCLGVGELVIPAIPELFKTWTKVFGFKPLEESKRRAMKGMSMMVFPGTDMLHKPLLSNQFADQNLGSAA
ncbi:Acyl-CoA N-acyltransferase, partial [Cynara cardunculus var. scolymus]